MTDVFDVLDADHAAVKQMLVELETGPSLLSGATEAQLDARGKIATELIIESSKHEAVEEQHFWPAVRDRISNGEDLADHAISQEDEAKHVLARLDKVVPSDPEFDALLTKLIPAAREHIAYEEERVWPVLRQTLTLADAEQLGFKLIDAKKLAPTRPLPATPRAPAYSRQPAAQWP
jgi:hemerythrin-like domain-containing protein